MKEKIKAALATKYKNLGLSDKVLEGMAAYLEPTITEEGQIEAAITAVDGLLKGVQSEVDTRVTTAVAKAKQPPTPDPAKPEGGDPPTTPPVPDDTPAWAKTLIETNKSLAERLQAIETGKSTESRKSQLETTLTGVSDAYKATVLKAFERMKFEKDEDFTSYLDEVKTDSASFIQTEANAGLGGMRPPARPAGPQTKAATKAEIQEVFGKPKSTS